MNELELGAELTPPPAHVYRLVWGPEQRLAFTLAWARGHEHLVDMGTWIAAPALGGDVALPDRAGLPDECGTVGCLAGHAALLAGAVPDWKNESALTEIYDDDLGADSDLPWGAAYVRDPDADVFVEVFDYARALFGFDDDDAERVFMEPRDVTAAVVNAELTTTGRNIPQATWAALKEPVA